MTNRQLITLKNPLTMTVVRGFGAYMPDNLIYLLIQNVNYDDSNNLYNGF